MENKKLILEGVIKNISKVDSSFCARRDTKSGFETTFKFVGKDGCIQYLRYDGIILPDSIESKVQIYELPNEDSRMQILDLDNSRWYK